MWTFLIITVILIVFWIYREAKNAPLECVKCGFLIKVSLNGKCPKCGFDNYAYKSNKKD